MMMKTQTKSRARLRALAMLPAIATSLCLINISCVKDARQTAADTQIVEETSNITAETADVDKSVFDEVKVVAYGDPNATETVEPEYETPAEYPGGLAEFYKQLSLTINFVGSEGRVLVGFTIDREGNLVNPHIINGLSEKANNEALRAIKTLEPKWTPAKDRDGNAVESTWSLPITFKIAK